MVLLSFWKDWGLSPTNQKSMTKASYGGSTLLIMICITKITLKQKKKIMSFEGHLPLHQVVQKQFILMTWYVILFMIYILEASNLLNFGTCFMICRSWSIVLICNWHAKWYSFPYWYCYNCWMLMIVPIWCMGKRLPKKCDFWFLDDFYDAD